MAVNKIIWINSTGQEDSANINVRFPAPIPLYGFKWNIALNKLTTYNSIWNISDELGNTEFRYNNGVVDRVINLEPGNYSFSTLVEHIHDKMVDIGDATAISGGYHFSIDFYMDLSDGDVSMILEDGYTVDFTSTPIRRIFGFNAQEYTVSSISENKADIRFGVDNILIHLNVVSGNSYYNGNTSDVIFSFSVDAQPNEIIIIEPNSASPVGINNSEGIQEIQLYLTDQNNRRLNLRDAPFSASFTLSPVV